MRAHVCAHAEEISSETRGIASQANAVQKQAGHMGCVANLECRFGCAGDNRAADTVRFGVCTRFWGVGSVDAGDGVDSVLLLLRCVPEPRRPWAYAAKNPLIGRSCLILSNRMFGGTSRKSLQDATELKYFGGFPCCRFRFRFKFKFRLAETRKEKTCETAIAIEGSYHQQEAHADPIYLFELDSLVHGTVGGCRRGRACGRGNIPAV